MAAPRRHDDTGLFLVMAEFLAWPEESQVGTKAEAIERAMRLNPMFETWSSVEVGRLRDRLKRNYGKHRDKLERLSRDRGQYTRPLAPTILGNLDLDPKGLYESEARIHNHLAATLREGSKWLLDLAELLETQFRADDVNPALLKRCWEIAELLDSDAKALGNRHMADWGGVKRPV